MFAVGLTPANAVLEGTIDVVFADESAYDVPEGVGIIAICVEEPVDNNNQNPQDPKIIRTYRTAVGKNGSFRFEKIMPGFYYLAVDPMSITLNGVTVEVDGHLFHGEGEGAIVLNGYGTINTLHVPAPAAVAEDPFKLKVLSIKAVDKSEIPLSDGSRIAEPAVSMKAGQAICIEFNKPIDRDADGTRFFFVSNSTQITGYTKHLIVNGDDGHGYAYVWHDSINNAVEDLKLWFTVSSFDKDTLFNKSLYVGYAYQLTITATNLYGYDYDNELVDGVFMADLPIVVTFDKEIPENSSVEGILNPNQNTTIPVNFEYDGKLLYAYAPLVYGNAYTLKFKITTDEGVVIYNTENGLKDPKDRNILYVSDDGNFISFSTADALVCNEPLMVGVYGPAILRFNHSIENDNVFAFINKAVVYPEYARPISLECEVDENILELSLPEGTALLPGTDYVFNIYIVSEQGARLFKLEDYHFTIPTVAPYFDTDFTNGLDDFEVVGEDYDYNSTTASFSWTSLGINLKDPGVPNVYQLWVRAVGSTAGDWILKASFNEISSFDYTYRDQKIKIDVVEAIPGEALLYTHEVEYILTSYDENGLMIQSPVVTISDEVGPKMTSAKPYIAPGKTYAELNTDPVVFTLETNEPIDSIKKEDVVVGGAHPEYFDVTWKMAEGQNSAQFTVKALDAPVQSQYAEGDLKLTITLRDSSYNKSELVLDFKQQIN